MSLMEALLPPSRFADSATEAAFRRSYLLSGLRLARMAALIGAGVAGLFWGLLEFLVQQDGSGNSRQLVRLGISASLAIVAVILYKKPRVAIRNYELLIGLPAISVCILIGALSLLPADFEHQTTTRLATAMTVACWLTYGFSRLPVCLSGIGCIAASTLTIVGATIHSDEYLLALILYVCVANLVGWAMSINVERRERALFVSSRKLIQLARKLEQSAKESLEASLAKSHILAAVNHDLRQPLASMALYLGLIDKGSGASGDVTSASAISQMRECVTAMSGNLAKLSDVALLQSRERALHSGNVDISVILRRLESVFSPQAKEVGAELVVRLPKRATGLIKSNEGRLWDVLSNLVSNALKYRSSACIPRVYVGVVAFSDFVRITIRDNGIGIDPAYHRRIFDEYFQIGNPQRDRERGYGLGLSIVRETISRLPGHELRLSSKPGVGTRFDVVVPLSDSGDALPVCDPTDAGLLSRVLPAPFARTDQLQGCYALVVEDDPLARKAIVDTMEGWGMLVDSVGSPDEALAAVRHAERLFDVVVSDFHLSGDSDGLGVIDSVRLEQGQQTPAIIVSGNLAAIDRLRLRETQAKTMSKPVDPERLRSELLACVEA